MQCCDSCGGGGGAASGFAGPHGSGHPALAAGLVETVGEPPAAVARALGSGGGWGPPPGGPWGGSGGGAGTCSGSSPGTCHPPPPPSSTSGGFSAFPVRSSSGEIWLVATDLMSSGPIPWGHTRSYSNLVTDSAAGPQGSGWFIKQCPELVQVDSSLCLITLIDQARWFDPDGSDWAPRFGVLDQLIHSSTGHYFTWSDGSGHRVTFYDFSSAIQAPKRGKFRSVITDSGEETFPHYLSSGRMDYIQFGSGDDTVKYEYHYFANVGPFIGMLKKVILKVRGVKIREVEYQYIGAGLTSNLQYAIIRDEYGHEIERSYYRYWPGLNTGSHSALQFVVGPQAFKMMWSAGIDPSIAEFYQLMQYCDHYFAYDTDTGECITETVAGGQMTFQWSRTARTSTPDDDYNIWQTKTVETQPDGVLRTVYTNFAGQVMLTIWATDEEEPKRWYDAFIYDDGGRVLFHALSSAMDSVNDSEGSLFTLKTDEGLVYSYVYWTESDTDDGAAPGYLRSENVRHGHAGDDVIQREYLYENREIGDLTNYALWKVSDYPTGSTPATTEYDNDFETGKFHLNQRTTIHPQVSEEQNGTGSDESFTEVFDSNGRLIWRKDERGFLTRFRYDDVKGAVNQMIVDVKTADISDDPPVPSGWSTPTGGGLHLITEYEADNLGRTTRAVGPVHSIDIGGTAADTQQVVWWVYLDPQHEVRSARGYKRSDSFTLINPVTITKMDKIGRVTDAIVAVRASTDGELSAGDEFSQNTWGRWTKSFYDFGNQLSTQRVYFDIPLEGQGTRNVHFNVSHFGYDAMKRLIRQVSGGGTIVSTVRNPMGWPIQTWVGTNDAGATPEDPSGGGSGFGNNMVQISATEYDGGDPGGDGNATEETKMVDGSEDNNRVTSFVYDWRNRLASQAGEMSSYQQYEYDDLDRRVATESWNGGTGGTLNSRQEEHYDPRGRIYQTVRYGRQGTGGPGLVDNFWFDPTDSLDRQLNAGSSLYDKNLYDGAGRQVKRFSAYGSGDIGSDIVMRQQETRYDDASNVIQETLRERFHDAEGEGELGDPTSEDNDPPDEKPNARVYYKATWPDGAGRPTRVVDYGTNHGEALDREDTAPEESADDVLLVLTAYSDMSQADSITDANGIETTSNFDDAGRLLEKIEDTEGLARTTNYEYNPDGKLKKLTAINEDTGNQVTEWIYGTELAEEPGVDQSDIASSLLLRFKKFPDSEGDDDRVKYQYNRQGELKYMQSQVDSEHPAATAHVYEYDKLGRLMHDRVTDLGTGIDGAVQRITRGYEARGMLSSITSYDDDDPESGEIVNQVLLVYNDFAQLETEWQSHTGEVQPPPGDTPFVSYEYEDGTDNTIRRTAISYPNLRGLLFDYGTSDGQNDQLSRVEKLIFDEEDIASYSYLGLNEFIRTEYLQPEVELTYLEQDGDDPAPPPNAPGDKYVGLDQFNRVRDQRWLQGVTPLERVQYTFDRNSNRVSRGNRVAQGYAAKQDEYYTYDALNQLTQLQRGTLTYDGSGTVTGITPDSWQEDFTLDPTGNWNEYTNPDLGTQERTHDAANEIVDIDEDSDLVSYDAAGNMTKAPKPSDWEAAFDLTYDAWNRLVQVDGGGVAIYAYDGLNRRTTKTTDETVRHFYYSDQWQILEERLDEETSADRQFVWGMRYRDDLVLRDRTTEENLDERIYVLHDYFHPTTLVGDVDDEWVVLERIGYDAYGTSRLMNPDFTTTDPTPTDYEWETRFGGYRWDAETELYYVRWRFFSPSMGRWLTRDPIYEVAGVNLYRYAENNPILSVDPLGQFTLHISFITIIILGVAVTVAIVVWCKRPHPSRACRTYATGILRGAEALADANYSTHGKHGEEGTDADALTHCIASCQLALAPGPCGNKNNALQFLQGRENTRTRGGYMDTQNNLVGFALATTRGGQPKDCERYCVEALNGGSLWLFDGQTATDWPSARKGREEYDVPTG